MAGHEIENEAGHITDLRPFLLSQVTAGHEIESEAGHIIDQRLVLLSQVTAGHEIESRVGMRRTGNPTSLSIT